MNKDKQPNVRINYIYRLFYEILLLIVPLITAPYVSRVLGADGVGIYSFTSSIMTYFTMFAALGTGTYGAREIAQHRDNPHDSSKLFYEIELMTVLTSTVCIILWIGVIIYSEEYRYYFMALLPLLFGTLFDISWFYTGLEKIVYIVMGNSICKIIGIILLFTLVTEKDDLILYMVIMSLVTMVGNLTMWIFLPRFLVKVPVKELHIWHHLKETLVYFIPAFATSIYTVLDKTLIGLITQDDYQNGYYEQANKVINAVKTAVFVAVNSVMSSRISYLFSQEKYEEIHRRIARSMDFILLLGFGAVFGILGVSNRFVPIFFGDGYEPVILLMNLMTPLILIIGVSNCLGTQYYTPSGQRARSARYVIAGSVGNLIMNLILIPILGAVGAVIGSIFAESIIAVLYMINCDRYITVKQLVVFSWKRLLSGILMLITITLFGYLCTASDVVILILQILIGVCVYFVLLILLRDQMVFELIGMAKDVIGRFLKISK